MAKTRKINIKSSVSGDPENSEVKILDEFEELHDLNESDKHFSSGTEKIKDFKATLNEEKLKKAIGRRELTLNQKYEESQKNRKRKDRKFLKIIFGILGIFLIVGGYLTYHFLVTPGLKIKAHFDNITETTKNLGSDLEKKDLTKFEDNFDYINDEITAIRTEIKSFEFLKDWDATKGYYENLEHISKALDKSQVVINKVYPKLKSVLKSSGFKTAEEIQKDTSASSKDAKKKAEEKSFVSLVMQELPIYINLYKSVEKDIFEIFEEIKQIDRDYIPRVTGLNLYESYRSAIRFSETFPTYSKQTVELMEYMPELLGSKKTTTYLLVLQNESEMRASGGIISAYGNLKIKNGSIEGEIDLKDSWNLEKYYSSLGVDVGHRNIYGQLHLMLNGCGGYYQRSQDSNDYPDINVSLNKYKDFYYWTSYFDPQNYPKYDHMLMINYSFSRRLMALIEPLEVKGYGKVSADNLYDLIKNESDDVQKLGDPERKKIIKEIANAAKQKFLNLSSEKLGQIVDIFVRSLEEKDIAFASPNEKIQAYFDKFDMSGKIDKTFKGDYFHLNEAQNCALKLNNWVRNTVDMEININNDGTINKNVHVKWEQKTLYNAKREYQYSATPKFTYRAWVRLFTPKDSKDFVSDGLKASNWFPYSPQNYYDEITAKQTNDNVIQFDSRRLKPEDPIKTQELNVSYKLPDSINFNKSQEYKLLIQKHPGKSWREPYKLKLKYKGKEYQLDFKLNQDKIITFKDEKFIVENYNKKLEFVLEMLNIK